MLTEGLEVNSGGWQDEGGRMVEESGKWQQTCVQGWAAVCKVDADHQSTQFYGVWGSSIKRGHATLPIYDLRRSSNHL